LLKIVEEFKMYIFLITIHVIVSLALIAVILLQAGKGGGMADTFGGGAAQSLFGTSTSKILTKATTVCAVTFILTSIALGFLSGQRSESLMKSAVVAPSKPVAAKTVAPAPKEVTSVTSAPANTQTTTTPQPEQVPAAPAK
jgi:preprotein translocase subunit SecG